jgi:hypothetical protein
VVALAYGGRSRGGAASMVPADVPLWAPLWTLERGVCSWLALAQRLRGGAPYRGERLPVAAHSLRTLRRRLADQRLPPAGHPPSTGHPPTGHAAPDRAPTVRA